MESNNPHAQISVAKLTESLNQLADQVFLIDLMNKEEYAGAHIPGAVNIPVEELESRLSEIPHDKTVVVACKRGLMKSDMALEKLQNAGFTGAVKVEGGTNGWFEARQ